MEWAFQERGGNPTDDAGKGDPLGALGGFGDYNYGGYGINGDGGGGGSGGPNGDGKGEKEQP